MFEHKVAIEQDGFDLREEAVVAVEVRPARLHHAYTGFSKVVDNLHDPLAGRYKVGVEDSDELAGCRLQTMVERSGFEAVTISAVNVDDGVTGFSILIDDAAGYFFRLVGGVIEDLDFEQLTWVIEIATGFDEAIDDELLIEDG